MPYWFVHSFCCFVAFVLWVATIYDMSLVLNVDVKFSESNKICIFLFYISHYIAEVALSGLCGLQCCENDIFTLYAIRGRYKSSHDDIIKWKRFPRYLTCMRESTSHRWTSLKKVSNSELWCFLNLRLNKRLSTPSRRRWFVTPLRH